MLASMLLGAAWAMSAWALPDNRTNPLTNVPIDAGCFQKPSSNVRPRFRYWIPDASIDLTRMTEDIVQAGNAGAGGVELLGYYLYGDAAVFPGTGSTGLRAEVDYDVYGFGTPAWAVLFKTALQAHKDNDLIMDFALGPNQGQGVPAPADSDGIAWDLVSYNVSVAPGGTFSGTIPGWGAGSLISLTSVAVIASKPYNATVVTFTGSMVSIPHINYTLAASSFLDHTAQVSEDGSLSLTFPTNSSVQEYRLFASYLFHNEWRATKPGPNPQNIIQNGSFAVDHFSALGAQTTTDFLQNYVLVNGSLELAKEVGNYAWEDSIEIFNNLYWTKYLPDRFFTDHGYSISDYIPLLLNGNNPSTYSAILSPGGPFEMFWTDESDGGQSHVDDYRTTLGNLYDVYISTLDAWAEQYLDMQLSLQVAYNLPVDVLSSVPYVDAPELESLGFGRAIDSYRQYVGPANLADKRIISSELGAVSGEAWQLFMSELLFDFKRSFAAGVNQMVIHGLQYSGSYPNTTWPGFTTFYYLFAEMHGRHQPAWAYYSDILDYVARLQFVLQSGVPQRDLAIWQKDTFTEIANPDYIPTDLISAGYGYEYLSPDNFALPQAVVEDNRLGSTGPAYKALLVRGNSSITLLGAQKLVEYANAGLPIIVQGGLPTGFVGYNTTQQEAALALVNSIASLLNVHQISYDTSVAATLAGIGIMPLTEVVATSTWYTYWRRDESKGMSYAYVYNDLVNASTGTVTFESTGTPYYFDAWTGTQTAVTNYTITSDNRTSIYLTLAGRQTSLIAFADEPLSDVPLPECGSFTSMYETIVTSNGTIVAKEPRSTDNITTWNLTITEWAPPADLFDADTIAVYVPHTFSNIELQPWNALPGMTNVSGTGIYSAALSTPAESQYSGALIDFGNIVHTIRVRINGKTLPPLDTASARADISDYLDLTPGSSNTIEAEVSTPMFNELRPIADQLLTSGGFPLGLSGSAPAQDYGLLDKVLVTWYDSVAIDCK